MHSDHHIEQFLRNMEASWLAQHRAWLEFLGLIGRAPSLAERKAALGLRLVIGGKKGRLL